MCVFAGPWCPMLAGPGSINFEHLSTEQGLSQSTTNAIAQDAQGFMWFGTQDGLDRYDGYGFAIFKHDPSDSLSISDNYIWSLLLDRNGDLWIGTLNNGLNCYKAGGNTFARFTHHPSDPASLANNDVTSLCQDSSGNLWIGTWGGGVDRFEESTGTFVHYRHDPASANSLVDDHVRCMTADRDGRVWIGTWGGLALLNVRDNSFTSFLHDRGNPRSIGDNNITSLIVDDDGAVWVGTNEGGMNRMDPATRFFDRFEPDQTEPFTASAKSVLSFCRGSSGHLWAGTLQGGLYDIDPTTKSCTIYRHDAFNPETISSDKIYALFKDRTGALWIGTADGGVSQFDPHRPQFLHYRKDPADPGSLSNNTVRAIFQDHAGALWVGTLGGGLDRLADRRHGFVHYRHAANNPRSLSSNSVLAVFEDREGEVWIGTEDAGLNRYDRNSDSFVQYHNGIEGRRNILGNSIMAIYEDRRGDLWVGTTGRGAQRYDRRKDTFVPFPLGNVPAERENGSSVWAIHEDNEGQIWFGTWGIGLVRYDPASGAFKRYRFDPTDRTSLSNNTVWCFYEGADSVMWLGTWGGGIDRYDRAGDRFSHWTDRDGLPNNTVYGILPDASGSLWLSTNDGLCRFTPSENSFRVYNELDGLQSDEFNQGAFCRGRDGELYFGGNNGFNCFQPESIRTNLHIPPVVLTKVSIFNQPVQPGRSPSGEAQIFLSYAQSFLSFEFAALDYMAPGKNGYAYRLEGVDKDWVYCGSRRYAAYTHLDGGTYLFRVKGSNNDGVWNDNGASIRLLISPPFWETWWFLAGSLSLAALAGLSLYRGRVRKLVADERLRTRIASDLHDELASNLSSIAMFSTIIGEGTRRGETPGPEQMQLMDRITALSQESISSIRDIIWAIDPKPERVADLLLRLKDTVLPFCRAHNVRLSFPEPVKDLLPAMNLTPEQRKHLWLLLKEAVTNVVKHSGCTEVDVSTSYVSGVLSITVSDNGAGFDSTAASGGKGLNTMSMRASHLGGTLKILSAPATGTTVNLTLKL